MNTKSSTPITRRLLAARWHIVQFSLSILTFTTFAADPAQFVDQFEGGTLDPFWSKRETSGSITYPSSTRAHSGTHSVQLSSTANTGQKNIDLFHDFSSPVYGRVSVWVYDTGADELSANYIGFFARNQAVATSAGLFTQDYDLGPSNGGGYYYSAPGAESILTAYDRTKAWHKFTITATAESLTLEVDETTVYSGPGGVKFDNVTMEIHGPTWRPAWAVQFDDFEFVEFATPIICVQPTSQMTSPGSDVTFSVAAGGSGSLSYQWQFNDNNIQGATNSILHLGNAGTESAGIYSVRISNEIGATESLPAILSFFGVELLPGLMIAGPVGSQYRVDYVANFGGTNTWLTLTNLTLPVSQHRFVDWSAVGSPRRFYRALLVP